MPCSRHTLQNKLCEPLHAGTCAAMPGFLRTPQSSSFSCQFCHWARDRLHPWQASACGSEAPNTLMMASKSLWCKVQGTAGTLHDSHAPHQHLCCESSIYSAQKWRRARYFYLARWAPRTPRPAQQTPSHARKYERVWFCAFKSLTYCIDATWPPANTGGKKLYSVMRTCSHLHQTQAPGALHQYLSRSSHTCHCRRATLCP